MRIKSLHIYPIKSTRAVDADTMAVEARGLAGDRRWMLVDADGKFITQRDYPQLARIQAEITASGLSISADGNPPLALAAPVNGEQVNVKVWKHEGRAYAAPDEASAWFSHFLGIECRLVWQGDIPRPTSAEWSQQGDEVSFADGYPILVTTTASLADLNRRMDAPVPMDRFRPNIVIECDEPWAEDTWRVLKIGDVELELVKPCARCVVTTTDQATGEKNSRDPLKTLTQFRLASGDKIKGAIFGQNAIPRKTGTIHVGDMVEVLSVQAAPAFKPPKAAGP